MVPIWESSSVLNVAGSGNGRIDATIWRGLSVFLLHPLLHIHLQHRVPSNIPHHFDELLENIGSENQFCVDTTHRHRMSAARRSCEVCASLLLQARAFGIRRILIRRRRLRSRRLSRWSKNHLQHLHLVRRCRSPLDSWPTPKRLSQAKAFSCSDSAIFGDSSVFICAIRTCS